MGSELRALAEQIADLVRGFAPGTVAGVEETDYGLGQELFLIHGEIADGMSVKLPESGEQAPVELWALDVGQRRISRIGVTLSIDGAAKTVKVTRQ